MHKRAYCFIDPKSPVYKPDLRHRKVARARQLGLPIPPELEVDDGPGGEEYLNQLAKLIGLLNPEEGAVDQLLDEVADLH